MSSKSKIFIAVIITALVVGGGVYIYMRFTPHAATKLPLSNTNEPSKAITEAPKVLDNTYSPDGKMQVVYSNSNIYIKSGFQTISSFPVPKFCDSDIDNSVWFGQDGKSVLYYNFCGGKDYSILYRLDATTGKQLEQNFYPLAYGLDVNDIVKKIALVTGTDHATGLAITGYKGSDIEQVITVPKLDDGDGETMIVTKAAFSPNGTKLFFSYVQRMALHSTDLVGHNAVYDLVAKKLVNAGEILKIGIDEGIYGWIDENTLVTKTATGEYKTYSIN